VLGVTITLPEYLDRTEIVRRSAPTNSLRTTTRNGAKISPSMRRASLSKIWRRNCPRSTLSCCCRALGARWSTRSMSI
jgi:hypothetical protein